MPTYYGARIPIAPSGADADDEQKEKADDEKWKMERCTARECVILIEDEVKSRRSFALFRSSGQ